MNELHHCFQPYDTSRKRCRERLFWKVCVECKKTIHSGLLCRLLMEELRKSGKYEIYDTVLDSIHMGCPQSRPRWYSVGILKSEMRGTFYWPYKKDAVNLNDYIERPEKISERGIDDLKISDEKKRFN